MKLHAIIILLFLSAVSGCISSISGNAVREESTYESGASIEAYFCPRENCTLIIKNAINNARSSVHCAFFELNSNEIIRTIAKKSHEANVKIVIDRDNF